jgi:hypothetical protein
LDPGVTYFWKVDEIGDTGTIGRRLVSRLARSTFEL